MNLLLVFCGVLFIFVDLLVYDLFIFDGYSFKEPDSVVFSLFKYLTCDSGLVLLFFYIVE